MLRTGPFDKNNSKARRHTNPDAAVSNKALALSGLCMLVPDPKRPEDTASGVAEGMQGLAHFSVGKRRHSCPFPHLSVLIMWLWNADSDWHADRQTVTHMKQSEAESGISRD